MNCSMDKNRSSGILGLWLLLPLLTVSLTGCAGVTRAVSNGVRAIQVKQLEKAELADIRSETREALAADRLEQARIAAAQDLEAARYEFQRQQMEADFCLANQEAARRHVEAQVKETVQSKLELELSQGLEVGELEVDVQALKQLLKDREAIKKNPPPHEAQRKEPTCGCAEEPCGCRPGLLKKHCGHCCKKSCGCPKEEDCGGPEALRSAQRAPVEALRPAEIPLKLPVRLTFGVENPTIQEPIVRREAVVTEPEPVKKSCGCPVEVPCKCYIRRPCGCAVNQPCTCGAPRIMEQPYMAPQVTHPMTTLPTPIPDNPQHKTRNVEKRNPQAQPRELPTPPKSDELNTTSTDPHGEIGRETEDVWLGLTFQSDAKRQRGHKRFANSGLAVNLTRSDR